MLRIVDPHELCEDLVIMIDPPRPTVCHPEMILHVAKSLSTTLRHWSVPDGPISFI